MRSTSITLLAATAAGLVTTLVLPAQAEPLGGSEGVRYQRTTVTIPASAGDPTSATGEATCPRGWESVGGGHTIRRGGDRGIASGLKSGNRRWVTEAWQDDAAESTLTTYAVCMRDVNVTEEDDTEFGLPAGPSTVTLAGSCPSGRVVSGGVTYGGADPSEVTLNSSHPIDDTSDGDRVRDDGWRARVRYDGGGGDSVSVFLVCLTGERPLYVTRSVTVPAGEAAGVRAFCPAGRPVLGGGLRAGRPAAGSHLVDSRPVDTRDEGTVPEDGWLGAVRNTSADDVTLTVHAVCR